MNLLPQGCEDCGRDTVFLEAEEDSQNESGEWERDFGEWERGEGSGESESDAPVGASENETEEEDEEEEEDRENSLDEREEEEVEADNERGGEEGEGDATRVARGDQAEAGDEDTVMEEIGVRDISESERGTQCVGEASLQRVNQLPPPQHSHAAPHTLTPGTPTTPVVYYSSAGRRQWLLEVALVLLVTTLLVTVCSRLSYDWLVRLYRIVPEKPI